MTTINIKTVDQVYLWKSKGVVEVRAKRRDGGHSVNMFIDYDAFLCLVKTFHEHLRVEEITARQTIAMAEKYNSAVNL